MKYLPEGAGSPISRMPQQQKAGYVQYTSPNLCCKQQKVSEVIENSPSVAYTNFEALEYWKKELANRDSKTVARYHQYLKGFVEYMGMTTATKI
jgi:hypothetical protein